MYTSFKHNYHYADFNDTIARKIFVNGSFLNFMKIRHAVQLVMLGYRRTDRRDLQIMSFFNFENKINEYT